MPSPVPLVGGVPGGPELLVILLVFVLFLAIPLGLVVLAVVFGVKVRGGDDETAELEERVEELERELERERADDAGEPADDGTESDSSV